MKSFHTLLFNRFDIGKLFKRPIAVAALIGIAHSVHAQISVGPTGSAVETFGSLPPITSWATVTFPGDAGLWASTNTPTTYPAMDASIQTLAASSVTFPLSNSTAAVPGTSSNAWWSSSGSGFVQTRPTGNAGTLLLATLANASGGSISAMNLIYDLAIGTGVPATREESPGFRIYYNLSGAAGNWSAVGSAGFGTVGAQNIPVDLSANPWPNSTLLYLLFIDDNASTNTDGAYQMDNFSVSVVGPGTCVGITNQSGNISVAERGTATFSISATGTPQTIQWYRSNNGGANYTAIPGASGSNYVIASVVAGDNGAVFYATVSNSVCNASSTTKTLTVIPDTVQPTAVSAIANTNLTTIIIAFSEPIAASSVTPSAFNVYLTSGSPGAAVDTATVTNGTNVIITVTTSPLVSGQDYSVRITGVTDTAATPNVILPNPTVLPVRQTVLLFPFTKVWRYIDTGTNLGTAWKETAYDDSAWPSGPGVLGLETTTATLTFLTGIAPPTGTNTVLSLTNNIGAGLGGLNGFTNVTFYFRTTVNIPNFNPASATLILRGYFDDGAALYINGTERFRYNLPAGATNTSFATANLTEAVLTVSNLTGLVQGDNVIAVEVHQDAIASSDIDFGLQLEALVSTFAAAGPRLTNSTTGGNNFTITWNGGGTLQKSANISSPANWVTIPGAASPFVTNRNATTNQFFRVIVP